jgi:hypothetical protein
MIFRPNFNNLKNEKTLAWREKPWPSGKNPGLAGKSIILAILNEQY